MSITTSPPAAPPKTGGRLLLWAGVLAAVLGLVEYPFQVIAGYPRAPWYGLALLALGTVAVLVALRRRFTVWRAAALLLTGGLTALQVWFVFWVSAQPAYTGPAKAGQPFPEFAAARADGTPFTQDDLTGDQDTVMVFFRGHW